MSDITKKIYSIDPEPESGSVAPSSPKPISADDGLIRPVEVRAEPKPSTPEKTEPVMPRFIARADEISVEPVGNGLVIAGGVLALLVALAIGAWVFGYFQMGASNTPLSPLGFAALIMAVIVPAVAVLLLFLSLRALQQSRNESARLAAVADRLLRADESVRDDVANLASSIRAELSQVDARLAQSRSGLETFSAQLGQQSKDMDATTKSMAERSETVGRALTLHRQAIESLATSFDAQMDKISQNIDMQRERLSETAQAVRSQAENAAKDIAGAADAVQSSSTTVSGSTDAAKATLTQAEQGLRRMSDQIAQHATELDAIYDRRRDHLDTLASRMSDEASQTETSLIRQVERLGAIDAQIEITETRLTALIDHAKDIQEELNQRLSDIDRTLETASQGSLTFTEDMTDRVTDSVAQARRDLTLMETELRALQARIETAADTELDLPGSAQIPSLTSQNRLGLKPLETDFPSLEPPEETPLELDDPIEDDLRDADGTVEPVDTASADIVTRPGQDAQQTAPEKVEGGWHWRDMLGGMDPLDQESAPAQTAEIERPPAGVPLAPPPPPPALPDGSDVVARLCEVQLAPSAIVDEGTIIEAVAALKSESDTEINQVVLARLRDPVVHLRGVLAADLEFRLKAESFVRSFDGQIGPATDEASLRSRLGSASGRAYLLCSAALRT